jgi:SAM-dependent methyltransferase
MWPASWGLVSIRGRLRAEPGDTTFACDEIRRASTERAPTLTEWERAEAERSASETLQTSEQDLINSEKDLSRYLNPPSWSAYSLEFHYSRVGDVAGRRVLDLGSGSGMNALYLARRGARVLALDISPELLGLAIQRIHMHRVDGVSFALGSAHCLLVADQSVDLVFGNAILHHLDLDVAPQEIFRVLRPGGRALFKEPVQNSPTYQAIRRLIPYRARDVSPYERPLNDRELRAIAAPYRRSTIRAFALPHIRLVHTLFGGCHAVPRLYRLDAELLRAAPRLERFAAVRVIELVK